MLKKRPAGIEVAYWVLAVLGLFSSGCKTASITGVSHLNVKKEVLSNGLTILFVEDHSVPIVSYSTWIRVGSAWEKPGKSGIAHLFEHLMFKGTPLNSGAKFFQTLESHGATVNAYTQKDVTVYYEVVSSEYLPLVIDLESDRLANLELTQEKLDAERQVVKEERRLRVESHFDAQVVEILQKMIFPTHPYGWPVIGYQEDLEKLTLEECRDFFHQYYQPSNAIVTIAGDFDYRETLALMKERYGKLDEKKINALILKDEILKKKEARNIAKRPVVSETIVMGYPIPNMKHPDMPAISMLSWALFGMASSRGHERLVRDKKVAVEVGSQADFGQFPGVFFISADARSGITGEKVVEEVDHLIAEVQSHPVTPQEMMRIQNRLTYSIVNETKSPLGMSTWLTYGEYYYGDYQKVFELLHAYSLVTAEDVKRVARKYLNKNLRSVVILKPEKSK